MSAIKGFLTVAGAISMLSATSVSSQQLEGAATTADASSLGGVVRSVNGPEAGVWVIAETTDMQTKFAKIVVTDDQGRPAARAPEGGVRGLGARLRTRGLAESPGRAWEDSRPWCGGGAERRGGGGVLSSDLLVFHAQGA